MNDRTYSFVGGTSGPWRVLEVRGVAAEPVPLVQRVDVRAGWVDDRSTASARWILRGVVSHERYVTRHERAVLAARQPPLGRSEAVKAALIPIRKSAAWWALAQDERRALLEERSHHIEIGLQYLPAVARRLHHGRDLGEPFDFLTWFEYAPENEPHFDALVARLRSTEEWKYVERECELRLVRDEPPGAPI
jgi:chlorite dismutase